MPNTREKLIELLKNNREHYLATYATEHHKSYEEYTADHLIANGVTIPVRCKDCKYYDERNEDCAHPVLWFEYCSDCGLYMKPDDFCSYGERREGE